MKYDVLGLGNPLIDVIVNAADETLEKLDIAKGSMNLVDVDRQQEILDACKDQESTTALGGSCANTMVMISQLNGNAAYCGKLGNDQFANDFEGQLKETGTASLLNRAEGATGTTVILVTPDAERSMNTHLGMCLELSGQDIDKEAIKNANYLYVEGYLWDTPSQKEAVRTALEYAKEAGVKISLTLSDSFCVGRHKEEFQELMDNYVDLLFCNEAEAAIMSGEEDPEKQLEKMGASVPHIVLTLGKKGSKILKDGEVTDIALFPGEAIDTTGAGDSFAAGYLYGITNDYSPAEAGALASCCATAIVTQIGPRYQGDLRAKVSDYIIR